MPMLIAARTLLVAVIGVVAVAWGTARRWDYSRITGRDIAAAEFAHIRERLPHGPALVDVKDDDSASVHQSDGDRTGEAQSFHALVYEMPSMKLLRVNVPFWAMRRLRSSGFTYLGQFYFLEDTDFDPIRVNLTMKDVERH